jgi:hypothetical protein
LCSKFDWFLTSILADVLEKAGALESIDGMGECSYSEWLLLNFIDSIMGEWDCCWDVVLDLLTTAPVFGKGMIDALICRVRISPLEDDDARATVAKVVGIAEGASLAGIHAVVGRAAYEAGQVGDAVLHYGIAGRVGVVEGIARGVMDRGDGDEVARLVECVGEVNSPTLDFLKRFVCGVHR